MTQNVLKYFLPAEDVNDETAIILNLYYKSGDRVSKHDLIYTFETTKAAVDMEATNEGYIHYHVEEGSEIATGTLVCEIAPKKREQVVKAVSEKFTDLAARPTKKALKLAQKHNLDLATLGLMGIIREKDLKPFIPSISSQVEGEQCLFLDKQDELVKLQLGDWSYKNLTSEEKIAKYRSHGHSIGEDVSIGSGSVLIGNEIIIEDHVRIGENTLIEAPLINIGRHSSIGDNSELVASKLQIGSHNRILNRVIIDIAGGRYPDSNFISGKGCLLSGEVYVNVCRQVKLGDNVALSPKAMIYTHSFWQSVLDGYGSNFGPVELADDTWMGSMAQILPNCSLGNGSIVISNSLVSQNVKAYNMVGGVPASVLKTDIKKKITSKARIERFQELFTEMGPWLHTQHVKVQRENDNLLVLHYGDITRSCLFFTDKIDASKLEYDIIIALDSKMHKRLSFSTLMDVGDQRIDGRVDIVETMIVNYFRRKGIRFFED